MYAAIDKAELKGRIKAIPSKSYAHRITICAALCNENTEIIGKLASEDFTATKTCLESLGTQFEQTLDGYIIKPTKNYLQNAILNCGESGSTLRFLLPIVAALNIEATFEGKGRLYERPMTDLIEVLRSSSVSISSDTLPFSVTGKINANVFTIRGDISSQYISGLLLSLPLLKQESEIVIVGERSSIGYINITLDVMKSFGIEVEITKNGYKVAASAEYKSPNFIKIEGDWSNAASWLAAGALCGDITVENLNINSVQGDRLIVEILKNMGAGVVVEKEAIRVYKKKLQRISFDADNTPDLVPIAAIAAASAEGVTVIKGVDRLKLKECDRLAAVMDMLKRLRIKSVYDGALKIKGGIPGEAVLYGYNDHRLVMAATIAATSIGNSVIMGIEAVKKSYPEFFEDYTKLGGKFDVLFE